MLIQLQSDETGGACDAGTRPGCHGCPRDCGWHQVGRLGSPRDGLRQWNRDRSTLGLLAREGLGVNEVGTGTLR